MNQDDELAPLLVHPLDSVPPEMSELFYNLLKYRADPAGDYYQITEAGLMESIRNLKQNNVYAVGIEPGDPKYKEKGHMYDPILQSFVQGAGGQISYWDKIAPSMVPVVLRGITKRKEIDACRAAGRDFYYIDTGYFGNGKKKTYHRITKNDVQQFGEIIDRPGDRLEKTGVTFNKFRKEGSKVLLAPPSQKLLNMYGINLEDWLTNVQAEIKQYTDREVVIRLKQGRSVRQSTDTMQMALADDVYCLVTFSSIAAGEALLCGKPAITLGPNAAGALCSHSIHAIENLKIPTVDEVYAWAKHLSYCQFTEPEMRDGTAWRILNGN